MCPAKEANCSNCNRRGHFAVKCYLKRKEKKTTQNSGSGQNSIPAEEEGDMYTLEATAAGEVSCVHSHITPKPTAWEGRACRSTGKNLPGPGGKVKNTVHTLPHLRFDIKKGKYVQTPLPKTVQMLLSIRFDQEQHSKLCVDTNKKDTVGNEEKVKTDIVAVPDTGASMDCSGMDILGML